MVTNGYANKMESSSVARQRRWRFQTILILKNLFLMIALHDDDRQKRTTYPTFFYVGTYKLLKNIEDYARNCFPTQMQRFTKLGIRSLRLLVYFENSAKV